MEKLCSRIQKSFSHLSYIPTQIAHIPCVYAEFGDVRWAKYPTQIIHYPTQIHSFLTCPNLVRKFGHQLPTAWASIAQAIGHIVTPLLMTFPD